MNREDRHANRIIPVLTEGDLVWHEGHIISDAVPPALQGAFADEPRWLFAAKGVLPSYLDDYTPASE